MTYKYLRVRNDIYDKCTDKEMKKFRTGNEIKQLFKPIHWYILISTLLSIAALVMIFFIKINILWESIPATIIIVNMVIAEYRFDRLLDQGAREKELQSLEIEYDKYIKSINDVLKNHGIDNKEKRNLLRNECQMYLDNHKNKFKSFKTNALSQLIGVPIGALISALIYKNSDAIVPQIIFIVLIGMGIIGIAQFIKWITFYTGGYLKDEKLLDVLDEIEYSMKNDIIDDRIVL